MVLVKDIGGQAIEADMQLDFNQLDSLPRSDQALTLLEAYDTCKNSINEAEVESTCDSIKNLIAFPSQEIPKQ